MLFAVVYGLKVLLGGWNNSQVRSTTTATGVGTLSLRTPDQKDDIDTSGLSSQWHIYLP